MTSIKTKSPITKDGFAKLEKELVQLKNNDRPAIIKAIAEARSHGDLSENAEYHSAKEKQGFIEGKIRDLESKISMSEVIDVTSLSGEVIRFGATVTLHDEDGDEVVTYKLVGEYEADIENQMLSITAPIGRALINKRVDEYVEVRTPKGTKNYKILNIEFK